MPNFSIDYNSLETTVSNKIYKLDEVKHRIEKVAFDLVKFKDSKDSDELWQIQEASDGSYIVAKYTDDAKEDKKTASEDKIWDVLVSQAGYIHIYYSGVPFAKFSSSELGLESENFNLLSVFFLLNLLQIRLMLRLFCHH